MPDARGVALAARNCLDGALPIRPARTDGTTITKTTITFTDLP